MIFAINSFRLSRVTMTNIKSSSTRSENSLAPMNPTNSLPATSGFQLFDSKTISLFVIKANITATTHAITVASR